MSAQAGESVGEAFKTIALGRLVEVVLVELPEHDGVYVQIDEQTAESLVHLPLESVSQVLRGLVQNALDAVTDRRHVRLTISANEKKWVWGVVDSGHGMSPDILQRASEPFFTTKPPGHGMGLGLFLAQNVVRRLGGTLDIQSKLHVGTTVTVTLPINPQESET
jgi:two-component system sensor histidine kinase RegB